MEKIKPKVLVIEDEEVLLSLVRKKLDREGFNVLGVQTALDGIEILKANPDVKVIWLDHYLLGHETGLDFVSRVKHSEQWKKIPIFVVSNTAGPDKRQMYIHLGVTKYYVKADYELDQIIGEIRKVIKMKQS